jgi:putative ABC transport system substrate-binding protein
MAPDVILANSPLVLRALRAQTSTIPIVFALIVDPVGEGFIKSLAQPGGNITGFTSLEYPLSGKWVELLKEIAPSVRQVVAINQSGSVTGAGYLRALESAAQAADVRLSQRMCTMPLTSSEPFSTMARQSNGSLIMLPSPLGQVNREMIVKLAARHRLPAIYPFRYYVASGGLMSYGVDTVQVFRRSASYVDRILKGEKPPDLPVQQPTKFELVINLKAAKEIDFAVPPAVVARADELIE